jgi:glycosyltransferase involved in cell wall biosynthesis
MSRIVIFVHDLRASGVVRDSLNLALHCAPFHQVTLVSGHRTGFLEEEVRAAGIDLVCLRDRAGGNASRLLAVPPLLHRWLRGQSPCVLVSMGNMGHATVWFASRGLRHVQRIYRISNEVARHKGVFGWLRTSWIRLLIQDANGLPLVGAALAANPLFAETLQSGVAMQMVSGVDTAHARRMASAPSPHAWFQEKVPVVLGIGRLRPQKNFGLLIEATRMLRKSRRVRLVIIGGGTEEERAALARQAGEAGLGEDFLLAGETQNVFCWLARAQVFALPSRWEGSSVALIEAMAAGTPIVASELAGDAAQVLDNGNFGRLFDGVNPELLADAIDLQLSDQVVKPGDRVLEYREPWHAYRDLIERVAASNSSTVLPGDPSLGGRGDASR